MADLLKDRTGKALISMSLPISIGMLSTFLFQVIDTYFVGQLGGKALAALSFASTFYFLLVGLFIGLSLSNVLAGLYAGMQMRKEFKRSGSALAEVDLWQEYRNDWRGLFK